MDSVGTTSRLDRIHNDFNKITSPNVDIFHFLIVKITLTWTLDSFEHAARIIFTEESAKINSLDPSVSKENFGSLCKIDFVGLYVLERIGAFTLQLGTL